MEERLFSEFSPVSTQEWEEIIQKDLKGADYEKKLIWNTIEGIRVKPYYRREDIENLEHLQAIPGQYPFVRGRKADNNRWETRQDITADDPAEANKIAVDSIAQGAEGVGFNAKAVSTSKEMSTLLKNIDPEKVRIHFLKSHQYSNLLELFLEETDKRSLDKDKICGTLNFDPLGYLTIYGKFYSTWETNVKEAENLLKLTGSKLPCMRPLAVNGKHFHNAGASVVQEVAFTLSMANEYMAILTDRGFTPDEISKAMTFNMAIGSNYFMEIAKLRAIRWLWARIVEQYKPKGEDALKMYIHATTSNWNKTIYDPYVNMLRVTTEAMSATLGGCDSIDIAAFDVNYKMPDAFSRRIARNTQIILKEESHFNDIADPAAGSYYIEWLTDAVAKASWEIFRNVEAQGGYIKAFELGFIKKEIEKTTAKRDMEIASRKTTLLGVNQYPNLQEKMLDKIDEMSDSNYKGGLKLYRGAEPFEILRLATERAVKKGRNAPKVFLLTIGNLAMRKARATFSTNFFGCVGYEIIDNTGFKTLEQGIEAALDAQADIIVICSSDEEYAETGMAVVKNIKEKNPEKFVIIAGNPVNIIDQLKQAGVDDFIHVRSDMLQVLTRYQKSFGIM